ncbi:hypothetical protein EE612_051297 [Oryza sativa]|nr:hypothetical protein EE612_051297 [Oryza sativa]
MSSSPIRPCLCHGGGGHGNDDPGGPCYSHSYAPLAHPPHVPLSSLGRCTDLKKKKRERRERRGRKWKKRTLAGSVPCCRFTPLLPRPRRCSCSGCGRRQRRTEAKRAQVGGGGGGRGASYGGRRRR